MLIDNERQGKINSITSDIHNILSEQNITNKEEFLSNISTILCQLDTDVAIGVMENFGELGEHQAHIIKVVFGY